MWLKSRLHKHFLVHYRFGYNGVACGCVILNDFLDHVDGIVAKAQRQVYGNIDNPLLGAFVDAFCDKVYDY